MSKVRVPKARNSGAASRISELTSRIAALEELLCLHERMVQEDQIGRKRAEQCLREFNEHLLQRIAEGTADLTAANDYLRSSELRLRSILDNALDAVITIDADGLITFWNPQAETIFGWTREEVIGCPLAETIIPPRYQDRHVKGLERFKATGKGGLVGRRVEMEARNRDGHEFPVELAVAPVVMSDQVFFNAFIRDISDRHRAQEALHELTGRLIRAQENERRRLARELHDDLNQLLALLTIELDQVAQQPPRSAAKLRHKLHDLSRKIRELSGAVHRLSHQLHPGKLEQLGLVTTLRSLCTEVARQERIKLRFSQKGVPKVIPKEAALCLYRIAQEAIQNMVRHSEAQEGKVSLAKKGRTLQLVLQDDGLGFDAEKAKRKGGLGLMSMEERLRYIGGSLLIESQPSRGTRLVVGVPLDDPSSGRPSRPPDLR